MNSKKAASTPAVGTRRSATPPPLTASPAPTDALLIYRKINLLPRLGVSETTLRRWMENDGFPRPRQLGPRAVGWVAAEVNQWLAERPVVNGGRHV